MKHLLFALFISSTLFSQTTQLPTDKNLKVAYFSSGCFWCVEAIYESVPGVKEVISGYAGSNVKNPTYKTIHKTGHAESVAVYYNPKKITYSELIDVYYLSQNPTTIGQKPDFGNSYRSIIFYSNEEEHKIAETKFNDVNNILNGKAVTEIKMINHFYPAEDYHQNYVKNHPENSYVKSVSIPRLNRFKVKFFKK